MHSKAITNALKHIHGLTIDSNAASAHVIAPPHLLGILTDTGLHEGSPFPHVPFAPIGPHRFDVAGFAAGLHAALKDIVVGYTMRIQQNGSTVYTLQWNWSKMPADGGTGWNPGVRMHVASCSKMVTGIAMVKLLRDNGLTPDTLIHDYLPTYWAKGPGIDQVTFRHLLNHTSGLNACGSASDFQTMKSNVAAGAYNIGTYLYQNMNFGLCRILLSVINGNVAAGTIFFPSQPELNDSWWDYSTIQAYMKYVSDHVFAPSGVSGPTLNHPPDDAYAYAFPATGNGWNSGDLTAACGGAGWHMSADELLAVMGTVRRSGTILTQVEAQSMLDDLLGVDLRLDTPIGRLYNKNGWWGDGTPRVEQSLCYFLPQDMELVVLCNSPVGAPALFFRDIVTNIYISNVRPQAVFAWKGVGADQNIYFGHGRDSDQYKLNDFGTSTGPALVDFFGTFMAWKGAYGDSRIWYSQQKHIDRVSWEPQRQVPGVGTSTGPALAVFRNRLYMAWKGITGDQGIYYTTLDSAFNWTTQRAIPNIGTSTRPAIAVFRDRLFMAWKGIEGDQSIYYCSFDGANWSPMEAILGTGTSASPTLGVQNDRLYMVWKGIEGDQSVYTTSFDGNSWAVQEPIPGIGTATGLTLGQGVDRLYLTWSGVAGDPSVYYSSYNGAYWGAPYTYANVGSSDVPGLLVYPPASAEG